MDLRIGTTPEHRVVGFDTACARPLLLVGDLGRGKTTWARFIARWWLAETTRHLHVFARWPNEWADLDCQRAEINHWGPEPVPAMGNGCGTRTCLVVVDGLEQAISPGFLGVLDRGRASVVITSSGICEDLAQLEVGFDCLGLMSRVRDPFDVSVCEGQGRLDWPAHTIPVVPDRRGPNDFPCHRWHTPEPVPERWLSGVR